VGSPACTAQQNQRLDYNPEAPESGVSAVRKTLVDRGMNLTDLQQAFDLVDA